MEVLEIQKRQRMMFINRTENEKVVETLAGIGIFDAKKAIDAVSQYGVFTKDQLEDYLDGYDKYEAELADGTTTMLYAKGDDTEYFDTYEETLRSEVINPDQLERFCKPLCNNHQEIVALLTGKPMTLTEIQYHLRSLQSLDGVRGRVSELVDKGIVERYYFSVKSLKSGEVRSYTYHYLVGMKSIAEKWVMSKFEGNTQVERVYLGADYEERIMNALSRRPVFVVELAEIFGITEFKLLLMLREFASVGKVKLFYQSVLKDGKNGKFVVYLPEREDQIRDLYKEIRHFFVETRKTQDFIERHKNDYMDYDSIAQELEMSDSLCIAYLTHLRKRKIVEQEGEDVAFSAFKFIWEER